MLPRWVALAGQAAAYASVPATIINWEGLPTVHLILIPIYFVALIGLFAAFRGATLSPRLASISLVLAAAYALMLLVEVINGDLSRFPVPGDAHFFLGNLILLAFPFFVLGMRASGATVDGFARVVAVCLAVAAAWSLWQYFGLRISRVSGFNRQNTITFAVAAALWGLFLGTRAIRDRRLDLPWLGFSLLALIPVLLSGTRLAWIGLAASAVVAGAWWAIAWRRWRALLVGAIAAAVLIVGALQLPTVQERISAGSSEIGDIVDQGNLEATSIGLRYAATLSGLRAFLDSPIIGYGLADVRVAALTHRPDSLVDFSELWHLHNQYVHHMVAFGITGLVFLLALLLMFPYAGLGAADRGMRMFSVSAALFLAIFMMGGIVFGRSPIYGLLFQTLGIVLLAEPLRTTGAADQGEAARQPA